MLATQATARASNFTMFSSVPNQRNASNFFGRWSIGCGRSLVASLALFIVILSVRGSVIGAESSFLVQPPGVNVFGPVDSRGALSQWIEMGQGISVGESRLPLRANFSTFQRNSASRVFGKGWWFPLIDSSVVELSERKIEWRTVTGRLVAMYAGDNDGIGYASKDGKWSGVRSGREFILKSKDGTVFEYVNGKISSAMFGSGEKFRWVYEKASPIAIVDGEGQAQLRLVHKDDPAYPNSIMVGENQIDCEYLQLPDFVSEFGRTTVADISPSLRSLRLKGGVPISMVDVLYDEIEGDLVVEILDANDRGAEQLKFFCDPVAGTVLRHGKDRYAFTNVVPEDVTPKGARIYEKYSVADSLIARRLINDDRSFMEELLDDGRTAKTVYIGTPGPSFNRVREISVHDINGVVESVKRNYYNEVGGLIRSVREGSDGKIEGHIDLNFAGQMVRESMDGLTIRKVLAGAGNAVSVSAAQMERLYTVDGEGQIQINNNIQSKP